MTAVETIFALVVVPAALHFLLVAVLLVLSVLALGFLAAIFLREILRRTF